MKNVNIKFERLVNVLGGEFGCIVILRESEESQRCRYLLRIGIIENIKQVSDSSTRYENRE